MKVFLKIFFFVSLLLHGISYSTANAESAGFSTNNTSDVCQNTHNANRKVFHQDLAVLEDVKLAEEITNITLKFSAIDLVLKSTRYYFKIQYFSKIREKLIEGSVFSFYPYLYIFFRVFRL